MITDALFLLSADEAGRQSTGSYRRTALLIALYFVGFVVAVFAILVVGCALARRYRNKDKQVRQTANTMPVDGNHNKTMVASGLGGTLYDLPSCTLELHKKSFIPRCLYKYI